MMMTKTPEMERVWIIHAERLTNSVNGNPRYDLTFTDGDLGSWTYRTSSDSSCNYEVTNYLNSRELIDVWLTKADRVYMMRPSQTLINCTRCGLHGFRYVPERKHPRLCMDCSELAEAGL